MAITDKQFRARLSRHLFVAMLVFALITPLLFVSDKLVGVAFPDDIDPGSLYRPIRDKLLSAGMPALGLLYKDAMLAEVVAGIALCWSVAQFMLIVSNLNCLDEYFEQIKKENPSQSAQGIAFRGFIFGAMCLFVSLIPYKDYVSASYYIMTPKLYIAMSTLMFVVSTISLTMATVFMIWRIAKT